MLVGEEAALTEELPMAERARSSPSDSEGSSTRFPLSLRLFILIFSVSTIGVAAYSWLSIRTMHRNCEQNVVTSAERLSETIQRSTHYGMLLNRKEDVHQIIRTIAEQPGVEDIRVYDKQGVITFSAEESEIGRSVDLEAEACVSCHASAIPLQPTATQEFVRIFVRDQGYRILGLINPIENAPECYNAACHAHTADQSVLGVLDITMSMEIADERLATMRRQAYLAAALVALLTGLLSALFILRMVRHPVQALISGARKVASGDLDTTIEVEARGEMQHLAETFNTMTADLKEARAELTDWSDQLERRLREKTEELSHSQRQVAHMDKMASLGKLAATVAHELNNPLAGILNYARLIERTIEESEAKIPGQEEIIRQLAHIRKEASRSGTIVKNLLIFARPSGMQLAPYSMNQILESSTMIVGHHLEMADIDLVIEGIEGDDMLVCDTDQLQQCLVALLVNAVEAMPDGGTIELRAADLGDSIELTVRDTGVGIPEDAQSRIFEPFYSSKESTDGAGLGLAVVFGIIQRHSGQISVESETGRGTTFTIVLPKQPLAPDTGTAPDRKE
jgi:two-component system NtrC family sensor kinase